MTDTKELFKIGATRDTESCAVVGFGLQWGSTIVEDWEIAQKKFEATKEISPKGTCVTLSSFRFSGDEKNPAAGIWKLLEYAQIK